MGSKRTHSDDRLQDSLVLAREETEDLRSKTLWACLPNGNDVVLTIHDALVVLSMIDAEHESMRNEKMTFHKSGIKTCGCGHSTLFARVEGAIEKAKKRGKR